MLRSLPPRFDNMDVATEALTLRTLNTFAIDLISIPSEEDLFWYVAQNVVGQLNFVDCVVYQADDRQTELTQVAAWGEKNPFARSIVNPLVIPFGRGITGQVAQTRQAIIVDDLLEDRNYISDTRPARSEICVPLMFRDRVMGVIDSEHPDPHAFAEAELEVLTTVAAMTSAKLELLAETQRSNRRYHDLVASHARLAEETQNRKALEAKLHEARKHEAIGRLTGRFAHEFNNLLTVISGNLEFLEADGIRPESLDTLRAAQAAAGRGADLIRDMLAFAQRRRLDPKVVDINHVVGGFIASSGQPWAGRIELALADRPWTVSVDQSALEDALFNLALNASEAMPNGGHLLIETDNVVHTLADRVSGVSDLRPGRYVRLRVADRGVGMARDQVTQIFDPFYTSKSAGTATGMGLSIVMGFMRQSGGTIAVSSELGEGSTFDLYFPALLSNGNDLLTINP